MKKIYFLFLITLFFSCEKNDEFEDEFNFDPNENYIEFIEVQPKPKSVISEETPIFVLIKYNISPYELEGKGFHISYWLTSKPNPLPTDWMWPSLKRKELYNRSGEYSEKLFEITTSRLDSKIDTLQFKVSIIRKKSENTGEFLVESKPIMYFIN